MWSNTNVKGKVGLSAGGPIRGGLINGEIRYLLMLRARFTQQWVLPELLKLLIVINRSVSL